MADVQKMMYRGYEIISRNGHFFVAHKGQEFSVSFTDIKDAKNYIDLL